MESCLVAVVAAWWRFRAATSHLTVMHEGGLAGRSADCPVWAVAAIEEQIVRPLDQGQQPWTKLKHVFNLTIERDKDTSLELATSCLLGKYQFPAASHGKSLNFQKCS
jgi:hypothetical protein